MPSFSRILTIETSITLGAAVQIARINGNNDRTPVVAGRPLEDAAEVACVSVAALPRHLFDPKLVYLQQELGPVDAHVCEIVTEVHAAMRPEHAREVVGRDAEVGASG